MSDLKKTVKFSDLVKKFADTSSPPDDPGASTSSADSANDSDFDAKDPDAILIAGGGGGCDGSAGCGSCDAGDAAGDAGSSK